MTGKDKFIYILISILTFGVYPILLKRKKPTKQSNTLSVEEKVTVNLNKLENALGGKENIAGAEYTQTKVKIFFNDRSKVNVEEVKSIKGISGVVASSKNISIIVGKQAKSLAEKI